MGITGENNEVVDRALVFPLPLAMMTQSDKFGVVQRSFQNYSQIIKVEMLNGSNVQKGILSKGNQIVFFKLVYCFSTWELEYFSGFNIDLWVFNMVHSGFFGGMDSLTFLIPLLWILPFSLLSRITVVPMLVFHSE